jgi:hypothetical protein
LYILLQNITLLFIFFADFFVHASASLRHWHAYYCKVWDYIRLDFTELDNSLSTAPFSTAFLVFDDIYDIVQYTYDFLFSILREHIINKNGTIRPKDKSWMFNEVRRALRFRAFSRYKKKSSH